MPETLYQAVYRPELGGLHRELPKALRTGRRRRKAHRRPDARRPGRLVDMTMIEHRPAEVAARAIPGHWQGDLIIGEATRSAIGVGVHPHLPNQVRPHALSSRRVERVRREQ